MKIICFMIRLNCFFEVKALYTATKGANVGFTRALANNLCDSFNLSLFDNRFS